LADYVEAVGDVVVDYVVFVYEGTFSLGAVVVYVVEEGLADEI
jgi:hypothetical protein